MNSRAIWSPAWPLPSLWRQSRHRRFQPPARSRSLLIHVAFLVFGCICVVCCLNSVPVLPQWPLGLTLVNCAHARTDMQLSAQMLTIRACSVSESCKTSYWETEQLAATCELGKIHVYKWANRKSVAFPLCKTFCSSAGRSLARLDAIKGLFVIAFPSAKTSTEVMCPRHPKAASGFIPAIAAFTASPQKNKLCWHKLEKCGVSSPSTSSSMVCQSI